MQVKLRIKLKENTLWPRKGLFAVIYGCDKCRSYILVLKVKVHIDHQGLKEIITHVKHRLIYLDFSLARIKGEPREEAKEEQNTIDTVLIPNDTNKDELGDESRPPDISKYLEYGFHLRQKVTLSFYSGRPFFFLVFL
jgi:hypothetical protein